MTDAKTRKHRVVIEVTFSKPVTEKHAVSGVQMLMDDIPDYSRTTALPNLLVNKLTAKQFTRVYAAERTNDPYRFDECYAEGNKGGSYVRLRRSDTEGMVHLEVGETCVHTVNQEISVVALAAILTAARNEGFQEVVNRYLGSPGGTGCPAIRVESDKIGRDPQ